MTALLKPQIVTGWYKELLQQEPKARYVFNERVGPFCAFDGFLAIIILPAPPGEGHRLLSDNDGWARGINMMRPWGEGRKEHGEGDAFTGGVAPRKNPMPLIL